MCGRLHGGCWPLSCLSCWQAFCLPCLTGTSWERHLHLGVENVWQDSAEQGFSLWALSLRKVLGGPADALPQGRITSAHHVSEQNISQQYLLAGGRCRRLNCQHPLDHGKSKRVSEKNKNKKTKTNIYFCFFDYAKAFDCVDHSKLWKILKEMEIPDH